MPNRISRCRSSGSEHLISVLNLGEQALTGVFPESPDQPVSRGPLELVWCPDSGLLQLAHSCDPGEMYGQNYGYRSGLNQSMVDHLAAKVSHLTKLRPLSPGDQVLDIGSNDGTLLGFYDPSIRRIGIDPTGSKFKAFYPAGVELVPAFFSRAALESVVGTIRARIVTSISMFYDLEDPIAFACEVYDVLADDGVWHLEQSYMPTMLRTNSYDTVCHEHLEYYSLASMMRILDAADLKIIDISKNDVNGGSFAVSVAKRSSGFVPNRPLIDWLLREEDRMGLGTPRPFREFEERVFQHRDSLTRLIRELRRDGKRILGYGASTKGNVLLQFCGFTDKDLDCIADVNPDKFGRFTPGSRIPIVSEEVGRSMKPDYFLVLPWHFRSGILRREREFLARGGHLIFPCPEVEIV